MSVTINRVRCAVAKGTAACRRNRTRGSCASCTAQPKSPACAQPFEIRLCPGPALLCRCHVAQKLRQQIPASSQLLPQLEIACCACSALLAAPTPNSIKKSQDFLLALQSVLSPKIEKELTIVRGFARTCWCAPRAASLPCVAAAVCHLKLIASRAQAAPTMLPVRCLFCCFFLARCLPRAGLQVLPAAECRSGGRAAC